MTTSERISVLIDELQISKSDFASAINVTPAYVSKIINKGAIPSERVLEKICKEFTVRESWLNNGEGEIFIELTKDQEIADFLGDLISDETVDFKKRLISGLAKLNQEQWSQLEIIMDTLIENIKK